MKNNLALWSNEVLLVEMKQIARFIDLELQKKGTKLMWSRDGKAGLALIAATKYDLILFNYDLSDMSGERFAEEISQIRPASVLIVLDSREKLLSTKRVFQRFAVSLYGQTLYYQRFGR